MLSRGLAALAAVTMGRTASPAAGGAVSPVEPPPDLSESVAAGGSLADVQWAPFTDAGGRIASYALSTVNVSGSATASGSGLGPYVISGEADGELLLLVLDALDASGNVLASAAYLGAVDVAVPAVATVHDVDWPQLWIDNGSVDVDLSAPGTYTLAGTDYITDRSAASVAATLKATGLEIVQTPGSSMDWSIVLASSLHADVEDDALLTCDMASTVTTQATLGTSSGVYAAGFADNTNWGSFPPSSWVGAGVDVNGSSSQNLVGIIRGNSAYQTTGLDNPKTPGITLYHRVFTTGPSAGAAYDASTAFDGVTLKPVGPTYTGGLSLGYNLFPPAHKYATAFHPAVWVVGSNNCEFDITITRTTWRKWPTPV